MKGESPSRKLHVLIWFMLVVLHFSILGTAMLSLGAFQMPIILTMAVVQTVLVMLIFMEVRYGAKLVRFTAVAGFAWLLIQFTLVAADYLTRGWH
jgi:caa(3)-type oxidase subunit IV